MQCMWCVGDAPSVIGAYCSGCQRPTCVAHVGKLRVMGQLFVCATCRLQAWRRNMAASMVAAAATDG